jgi:glutathione synthase/RimK-type ligase-like ATP-grasp enzyme
MPVRAIIVGDADDPHVTAVEVATALSPCLVLDASSIGKQRYSLTPTGFRQWHKGEQLGGLEVRPATSVRGWIRRIAPPDWHRGVVVESHDAAVRVAWLSLLTAVIRGLGVEWLTDLDRLVTAENKLVQQTAATKVGARIPETVVTNSVEEVRDLLGDRFVIKPLGPGHYFDGETPFTVFTTEVATDDLNNRALESAPFIAQQRLVAQAHLRVVTVKEALWAARLDAADRPLDWRSQPEAHSDFHPTEVPAEIRDHASAVAGELGLGYSSQDWIATKDGLFLVDVNPAGQWLFLPPQVADPVTAAIAGWLTGQQGATDE